MGTAFLYCNGGSGGKGAALTVTAPAGSTVTATKDGKTLSRVAGADGVVVFRGLETGTWTLTSTDGTQTASKTVEIVADYATSMDKLYLYNRGDEQASVTGGWQARGLKVISSSNSITAPNLVKNTESMSASLEKSGDNGNGGVVEIVNDVDLTGYKKLVVAFAKIKKNYDNKLGIIVYDRKISQTGSGYSAPWSNTKASLNVTEISTEIIEYSVDIESINETACVGIALYNAASPETISCEITKVELVL